MNKKLYGKLVFEISHPGRSAFRLPKSGIPVVEKTAAAAIPAALLREQPLDLPECDEPSLVRHYNNMSTNNFGVDTGFYPLGSCTMKHNPKINEEMAALPEFAALNPATPAKAAQGALAL